MPEVKRVRNFDLRIKIKAAGLYTYHLAEYFDVSEMTIYRWLNDESEETKKKFEKAIEELNK